MRPTIPNCCIVDYKDDATAFNGLKKGTIAGKGVINNRVTNYLMKMLEKERRSHPLCGGALRPRNRGEEALPSSRWRSSSATSPPAPLPSACGVAEGTEAEDAPCWSSATRTTRWATRWSTTTTSCAMELATKEELETIMPMYAFKVNEMLKPYFLKDLNIELIDFKLEFGRLPTAPSFWRTKFPRIPAASGTATTGEKLDKDRFRRDLGGVEDAYHEDHAPPAGRI